MSVLSEFREFAIKGNVIDLAVGIVIGTAFGKIVNSLVNDVVMPRPFFLALSDRGDDDRACRAATGGSLWTASERLTVQPG